LNTLRTVNILAMVTLFYTIDQTQSEFKKQRHTQRTQVINITPYETSGDCSLAEFEYKLLQDGLKSLSLRSTIHSSRLAHHGESVELYVFFPIGRTGVVIKPLTPDLNPSAQSYLMRFCTGDFVS
jgi:hypothetical protein